MSIEALAFFDVGLLPLLRFRILCRLLCRLLGILCLLLRDEVLCVFLGDVLDVFVIRRKVRASFHRWLGLLGFLEGFQFGLLRLDGLFEFCHIVGVFLVALRELFAERVLGARKRVVRVIGLRGCRRGVRVRVALRFRVGRGGRSRCGIGFAPVGLLPRCRFGVRVARRRGFATSGSGGSGCGLLGLLLCLHIVYHLL